VQLDRINYTAEIEGFGGKFPNKQAAIYCQDAGTATRFLIPACAAIPGEYQFSASPRMSERPLAPLLNVLKKQGAHFNFRESSGYMPLVMEAHGLKGDEVYIDITQSSQFLSGLLMAAPYAKSPMKLKTGALTNKPYVAMTCAMMATFGISTQRDENTIFVPEGVYQACDYAIEPDASTASYFFAMAAITAGKVHVKGMTRACLQGDIRFLEILEKMGCKVIEEQGGITVVGTTHLKGLGEVDMAGFTDTFMTVAVLAVFADQSTTIKSLAHTRLQESDRVAAIVEGLNRLGIQTETTADSITIHPGKSYGAAVSSHRDHRIAMSLSLIGLKVPGVIIEGADAVAKTCPNYFQLLKRVCQ